MPVTDGHGNPKWAWEETILALNLYFLTKPKALSEHHPKVIELSDFLRLMPIHPISERGERFRNPASVAFKLLNLRSLDTGIGLQNVSKTDRAVFEKYGSNPEEVARLAQAIKESAILIKDAYLEPEEEIVAATEGRLFVQVHNYRERNRRLRSKKVAAVRASGGLACEVCLIRATSHLGEAGEAIFEVHHTRPLFETGVTSSSISDLALLCANCHRLAHALIRQGQGNLSIKDLQNRFQVVDPL